LAFWTVIGCGSDEPLTAVRIELAPNASLNTRQEVRAALDVLEIVVDGIERPLRGLPSEPGPVGDLAEAANRDGDDELELVYTLDLEGWGDLPVLQFETGQNGDQALSFRLFGLDEAAEEAAVGQVVVAFQPDAIVTAQAPFNLKAAYRVPRVVAVQPDPEAIDVRCDASLKVTFSEGMEAVSTRAAFSLRTLAGAVDGEILFQDGSTELEFRPARLLAIDAYSLEVDVGATDEHGERLDQDPYQDGAQPFISRFTVAACP